MELLYTVGAMVSFAFALACMFDGLVIIEEEELTWYKRKFIVMGFQLLGLSSILSGVSIFTDKMIFEAGSCILLGTIVIFYGILIRYRVKQND